MNLRASTVFSAIAIGVVLLLALKAVIELPVAALAIVAISMAPTSVWLHTAPLSDFSATTTNKQHRWSAGLALLCSLLALFALFVLMRSLSDMGTPGSWWQLGVALAIMVGTVVLMPLAGAIGTLATRAQTWWILASTSAVLGVATVVLFNLLALAL